MPADRAPEVPAVQHAASGAAAEAARAQYAPGATNRDYRAAQRAGGSDAAGTPGATIDHTGITFDAHPPSSAAAAPAAEAHVARPPSGAAAPAAETHVARPPSGAAAPAAEAHVARPPSGAAAPAAETHDAHPPSSAAAAPAAETHWYSGVAAVAADLFTGAKNEIVNHPGRVVGSAAIGAAAVAAIPVVAAGAAALGVGAATIATGTAIAEGAVAAGAVIAATYQTYMHGGDLLHDAHVVANPQNYSSAEQQKAHAGLQDAGGTGLDLAAGGLAAAGAAGALRGALTGAGKGAAGSEGGEAGAGASRPGSSAGKPGEVGQSAEGSGSKAGQGSEKSQPPGDSGADGAGKGGNRSNPADAASSGPHAPPDNWPKGIVDKAEPPVKEGYARLYRGVKKEAEGGEFQKPLSDEEARRFDSLRKVWGERPFTREEDEFMRSAVPRSRAEFKWYTDDLTTAKDYAKGSGKVLYVDVPVSDLGRMAAVTGHIGSGRAAGAFEVPYGIAKGAREDVHSPTNMFTQPPQ